MKRHAQILLLVLSGLGLLHATLFSDLYLRYVKEGLRPLLIASGALLLLLGLVSAALDRRRGKGDGHAHGHDQSLEHGHDHSTAPRIAWLLFLPALSLLLYAPPALGAYTASRAADKVVKQEEEFDPLPAASPVQMTLTDFTARVQQDRKQEVRGRSIKMTGFVTPGGQGDDWYLTRIIFTCCAADSESVKVRMHGTPAPPPNAWVAVTGTWYPQGTLGTKSAAAILDVQRIEEISPPVNSFTDDLPLTPS